MSRRRVHELSDEDDDYNGVVVPRLIASNSSLLLIRKLDINNLPPTAGGCLLRDMTGKLVEDGVKYIVIGKPGCGKSGIIKNYMYAKSNLIPAAKIMSGTEELSKFYGAHMPTHRKYVEYAFSKASLGKFMKRQKYSTQHLLNPRALIVLDDVFDSPSDLKCKEYRAMLKNGRHYYLYHFVGMQYCMDMEASLRMCFDGAFICREQNNIVLKKLWENFGGIIPDLKLFMWIMGKIATNYCALYVDNRRPMADWHECVYWYRGHDPGKLHFDFGSHAFHTR